MRTKLLAAAALLAVNLHAAAQERPTIGLGIGIAPFAVPAAGAATVSRTVELYVPIAVAPQLRIEPSLGIATDDQPAGPNEVDTRDFTLGLGVFLVNRMAPAADMYVGGRLRLNFAKISTPVGSDTGTDLQIAAALGGEYYFVPRFSLGLEGELGLYQNSRVSGDNDGVFTTGIAFLRVYFK